MDVRPIGELHRDYPQQRRNRAPGGTVGGSSKKAGRSSRTVTRLVRSWSFGAWRQNLHRRTVRVRHRAGPDMLSDNLDQGAQQRRRGPIDVNSDSRSATAFVKRLILETIAQ